MVLQEDKAIKIIDSAVKKFSPRQIYGHLSIGGRALAIPLEKYEYTYSQYLGHNPAVIFFGQSSHDKNSAVRVSDGSLIGKIMYHSIGMEYFVTDPDLSYLLAVNWYAIEGEGAAKEWMAQLEEI